MEPKTIGVLFVCLGNICRSPMAEAVFRHLAKEAGVADRLRIDSAGTGDWHVGRPPHRGTQTVLDRHGISYEGLYARQVRADDLETFDYIVAMDNANEADLQRLRGDRAANVLKLLDLLPDVSDKNVPDPYYTGNFDEVYRLVEQGCRALLERIRAEHNI